jgi:hypothetical protein
MSAHDHVQWNARAKRLACLVTLAGVSTFAWATDAFAFLALASAAKLAVLVEPLRVSREALLDVLLARSPTHEYIVRLTPITVNQYCGYFRKSW